MAAPQASPLGDNGPGSFSLKPAVIIVLVALGLAAPVTLGVIVLFIKLRKVYRSYRARLAIDAHFGLVRVRYPPEGAAYDPESAYASCAICRADFGEGKRVARLACSHLFCPKCIRQALQIDPRCPHCRVVIPNV